MIADISVRKQNFLQNRMWKKIVLSINVSSLYKLSEAKLLLFYFFILWILDSGATRAANFT